MNSEKQLYKIGYLTKTLGITSRTVRYYDQMGLLPHVKRSRGNVRLFDDEDLSIMKKILKLQKEDQLPLTEIRKKLFGEKQLDKIQSCVLTDLSACIPGNYVTDLHIHVMLNKLLHTTHPDKLYCPSREDFIEQFASLEKAGFKHIYVPLLSSKCSDAYTNAVDAKKTYSGEVQIDVVECPAYGPSVGLMAIDIAESILNRSSHQEISILIKKQKNKISTFTMLSSIGQLFNNMASDTSEYKYNYLSQVAASIPLIYQQGESSPRVLAFSTDREMAQQQLAEIVQAQIDEQGNYAKKILITYAALHSEAKNIAAHIRGALADVPIDIAEQHQPLNHFTGPHSVSVCIL